MSFPAVFLTGNYWALKTLESYFISSEFFAKKSPLTMTGNANVLELLVFNYPCGAGCLPVGHYAAS